MIGYGALLIAVLVLVSGVIAYVGDVLGRWLGRRRVTLFGLRPRHTAMLISVVAGMLIAGWTLGASMAVSQDVRDGLTRVVALRQQIGDLKASASVLGRQNGPIKPLPRGTRPKIRWLQPTRSWPPGRPVWPASRAISPRSRSSSTAPPERLSN
jgi:hypothetical protein